MELYADRLPPPNPAGYVLALVLAPPIIAFGVAYALITAIVEKSLEVSERKYRVKESALKELV
jgi:hypothetical protein